MATGLSSALSALGVQTGGIEANYDLRRFSHHAQRREANQFEILKRRAGLDGPYATIYHPFNDNIDTGKTGNLGACRLGIANLGAILRIVPQSTKPG